MSDLVPRSQLTKQAVSGAAGIGGGVALFILRAVAAAGFLPGAIVGGIIALAGLIIGSSKEDRTAGWVVLGAGLVTVIGSIPRVGGAVRWLLPVAGIALLIMGGVQLFRFFRNLRKRA
jgi:hypothetical protein